MGRLMLDKEIEDMIKKMNEAWDNIPEDIRKTAWYPCASVLTCSEGKRIRIKDSGEIEEID